jgi:hypothetical protein
MEFVYVRGGRFEMGDIFGDGKEDEKPVHEVRLDGFWIGKYVVTQGEWKKLMGNNPFRFRIGDNYPVEQVNWYEVEKFISRLNEETGINYRLPTEAEWEYAARSGGKKEKWAGTSDESELTEYSWYFENSGNKPHQVGRRKANGLGVYDMSGNVWEWVEDWYDKDYYRKSSTDNPQCKQLGYERHKVIRGGMFQSEPMRLRTTRRASIHPQESHALGFRLVLPAQPEQPFKREKEQPITSEEGKAYPLSQNYIPAGTPPTSQQEPLYEPSSKPREGGLGVGAKTAASGVSESKKGPSGVGGWLQLLVGVLLFIGPLLGFGHIASEISSAERQYPAVVSLPQWGTFKLAIWSVFFAVAVLSVYGGWGLGTGKDWSVVKRAKIVLWLVGPFGNFVIGVIVPIVTLGFMPAIDSELLAALIMSVIATVIWTTYLSKSKRVRNTYGPPSG